MEEWRENGWEREAMSAREEALRRQEGAPMDGATRPSRKSSLKFATLVFSIRHHPGQGLQVPSTQTDSALPQPAPLVCHRPSWSQAA